MTVAFHPTEIPPHISQHSSNMKTIFVAIFVALLMIACGQSTRIEPRRQVQYQLGESVQFQMQAESADDETASKMHFTLKGTSSGLFTTFKYESNNGIPIEYKTLLTRIMEFVPKAGDAFSPLKDTPVQTFVPSLWKPATVSISTVNGVKVYEFTLETTNGVFAVIGHVVTDKFVNNTAVYSANSIKMDYLVKNWTYTQSGSKLALDSRVETSQECRESVTRGDRIEIDGRKDGKLFGSFQWKSTVDADGVSVPVLRSTMDRPPVSNTTSSDSAFRVIHTFNTVSRVKFFNWDPTIGVTNSGIKPMLGFVLVLTLLCFLI